ncbi:CRISPR-associated endonuclease Cas2 [Patescibacteria group bacterium]|nr:CRISPR-associated endonuclease Cas2 [Patescibacteria group bacterium]
MHLSQLLLLASEFSEGFFTNYRQSWRWVMSTDPDKMFPKRKYQYAHNTLVKKSLIKTNDNLFKLTQKGQDEIYKLFPLLKWRKKSWDNVWRVVMYDFPETHKRQRNLLRRFLKKIGFAQWQLSVWISPHPAIPLLNKLLTKNNLHQFCSIHESKRVIGVSDKKFAQETWSLTKINQQYQQILDNFNPDKKHEYFETLLKDPLLPKELLPLDYLWEKLMKKITSTPNNINDRSPNFDKQK